MWTAIKCHENMMPQLLASSEHDLTGTTPRAFFGGWAVRPQDVENLLCELFDFQTNNKTSIQHCRIMAPVILIKNVYPSRIVYHNYSVIIKHKIIRLSVPS